MRISFCSCQVAGNGWYLDFGDKGNRSNGPITCIWESIAPSGILKVSGAGFGSCLTYGSVLIDSKSSPKNEKKGRNHKKHKRHKKDGSLVCLLCFLWFLPSSIKTLQQL